MKHRHTHLIRTIKDLVDTHGDYALAFASEETRRELYTVIGSIPALRNFLGKLPFSSVMGIAPEGPPSRFQTPLTHNLGTNIHQDFHRKNHTEWLSSKEGKVATVICRFTVESMGLNLTNENALEIALDLTKEVYKDLVENALSGSKLSKSCLPDPLSVDDYTLLEVFNEIGKGLAPFGLKLRHLAHHKDSDSFIDQIEVIPQPYL